MPATTSELATFAGRYTAITLGARVKSGLHGTAPSLGVEHHADLTYSTDFRGVYATVLDRWLACDSQKILSSKFAPFGLV